MGIARAGAEAFVDDQLETPRDGGGRRRRDGEGARCSGDVAGVAQGEFPHHAQILDRSALGPRDVDSHGSAPNSRQPSPQMAFGWSRAAATRWLRGTGQLVNGELTK